MPRRRCPPHPARVYQPMVQAQEVDGSLVMSPCWSIRSCRRAISASSRCDCSSGDQLQTGHDRAAGEIVCRNTSSTAGPTSRRRCNPSTRRSAGCDRHRRRSFPPASAHDRRWRRRRGQAKLGQVGRRDARSRRGRHPCHAAQVAVVHQNDLAVGRLLHVDLGEIGARPRSISARPTGYFPEHFFGRARCAVTYTGRQDRTPVRAAWRNRCSKAGRRMRARSMRSATASQGAGRVFDSIIDQGTRRDSVGRRRPCSYS